MATRAIAASLEEAPISAIAEIIAEDWENIRPDAVHHIEAMRELRTLDDEYFAENGRAVVGYFLANALAWRGETARAVKAELWHRIRAYDTAQVNPRVRAAARAPTAAPSPPRHTAA